VEAKPQEPLEEAALEGTQRDADHVSGYYTVDPSRS